MDHVKKTSGERLYKAFVYLVLGLLAISIIVPVAWVFLASIKQNSEFYGNPWALPAGFYWQNFVDAWNKASMGSYMLNSVIVTALALAILLVVALPAAYVLSRFQFKGRKFLNVCFMGGLFINVNYIVVPIFLMLRDGDLWLKNLVGGSFLLNNIFVLAVVYAATALPFTIYLLSGYFATLPHDYEEAAYIDGAGYGRTMISVIFPMAQPSIITIILFNFLSFWNEYIISLTLLSAERPQNFAGWAAEPDAGAAVGRTVRHYVCRPCAGNAAHSYFVYLRTEKADPGHDCGRPERVR